jgi:hypothetical protein
MPRYFILEGHIPVACDVLTWSRWFEDHYGNFHVNWTEQDDVCISTVFLGINHNFFGDGPPILFETMVFIAGDGVHQERYRTWDEAAAGHLRWVNEIFKPTPILTMQFNSPIDK